MPAAPGQHRRKAVGKGHVKPRKHNATDKRRGSARERGYSTRWDQFSKQFRKANPLCEYCLASDRYSQAEVADHDLPHRGDPDLFWNNTFTALCRACHDGPKARAEARYSGDDLLRWVARQKGS